LPDDLWIQGQGYLVVPCHYSTAQGTSPKRNWKSGGAVYLFDRPENGNLLVDAVTFGFQAQDFSLGRDPLNGSWSIAIPTPREANIQAATASPRELRINEWLAQARNGED